MLWTKSEEAEEKKIEMDTPVGLDCHSLPRPRPPPLRKHPRPKQALNLGLSISPTFWISYFPLSLSTITCPLLLLFLLWSLRARGNGRKYVFNVP